MELSNSDKYVGAYASFYCMYYLPCGSFPRVPDSTDPLSLLAWHLTDGQPTDSCFVL